MQKALQDVQARISGIRREQTAMRAKAKIVEFQEDSLLKVNLLLNWTKADVTRHVQEYNLPSHPYLNKGYRSVDCTPCAIAVGVNEDERAGHWAGRNKVECGLHTVMFTKKDISEL